MVGNGVGCENASNCIVCFMLVDTIPGKMFIQLTFHRTGYPAVLVGPAAVLTET